MTGQIEAVDANHVLATPDESPAKAQPFEPTSYQRAILIGLNRLRKHVYAGTAKEHVTAKRRARNRRARAARRVNR